jgi:alkanesulfonate monooxygenase SsuD/methylene tetrahydromethanopterin reductase-like flavin-dependent oxidoreductase (luciferase family)
VKVSLFQQAAYRALPGDFEQRYDSVVTTPYGDVVEPGPMYDSLRWYIDELLHGARLGFDGVAVSEHGQCSYDMVPNPSLPAAVLANTIRQEDLDTALVVIGKSLGKTKEPLRVAEEYAVLDYMSGGRLVAGFPMGLSYDANINQGIPAIETRERFQEAQELVLKAWTSDRPFTWNGKYSQYAVVNPWPRPVQRPHPPVWIPGSGTPGTIARTLQSGHAFAYLSLFGPTLTAKRIFGRFWETAEKLGKPANPYRVAFVQSCAVAETDERAEKEYGPHFEQAFRQCYGSIPAQFFALPGYVSRPGVEALIRDPGDFGIADRMRHITFEELLENQCVIVGSPATVRDRIAAFVKEFRIGNLLVFLHQGSMPHELVLKNIDMFAAEVLPDLQGIWADEDWEHHWWPTGMPARAAAGAAAGV